MMIDESFKLFGLLSIILTWASIGYILITIERNLAHSISHHAAVKRRNYIVFSVLMSASLVTMYLFMVNWFIPTLQLPVLFTVIIMLGIVLEFIATFIPLTTGWKFTVHQLASYGTALLIPVLLVFIALSSVISMTLFYVALGSTLSVLILLCLFLFVKKMRTHFLVYQSLYILAFHVTLVTAIYFP